MGAEWCAECQRFIFVADRFPRIYSAAVKPTPVRVRKKEAGSGTAAVMVSVPNPPWIPDGPLATPPSRMYPLLLLHSFALVSSHIKKEWSLGWGESLIQSIRFLRLGCIRPFRRGSQKVSPTSLRPRIRRQTPLGRSPPWSC
jgi:hypothetical protein